MSKRFIDTEIWDKEKFCSSPPQQKLLTIFIMSKCDCIGVFKMAPILVNAYIGSVVTKEAILSIPADIVEISDGVYWLEKFCKFQYGELKESCKPHRKYIEMLKSLDLFERVLKGYTKGIDTLQEKEQEKEEDKDKDKKGIDQRKFEFEIEVKKKWNELGGVQYLSTDEAKAFFEYWVEFGTNDKLMRFEKEKSFGIGRRIGTWKKNNFNGKNGDLSGKPQEGKLYL